MEYRTLGKTGLKVSVIGIGTWPIGGLVGGFVGESNKVVKQGWAGAIDEESVKTIRRAEELGINLVHSSEIYGGGHAEAIVGMALRGRRDRFVIATKVRPLVEDSNEDNARRRIREGCEASLRRLQTDYIDIHQLHTVPNEETIPAVMDEFARLQQEGKIRWVGISSTDAVGIPRLASLGDLGAMMFGHNIINRAGEKVFRLAEAENLGTVVLSPLAAGVLTGRFFNGVGDLDPMDMRYEGFVSGNAKAAFKKLSELRFLTEDGKRTMVQAALRFILDTPGVTTILTGVQRPSEIEENAGAVDVLPLTDEERTRAIAIANEANRTWGK